MLVAAKSRSSAGKAALPGLSTALIVSLSTPLRCSDFCTGPFWMVAASSRCCASTSVPPRFLDSTCASMITRIASLSNWSKNIKGAGPTRLMRAELALTLANAGLPGATRAASARQAVATTSATSLMVAVGVGGCGGR